MPAAAAKKPNFLVIVVDDLGFSDLGCFGGEIQTPNLDRLAKEGLRLTEYHTAAACSPTRSMIMSGTDNHIAGVGCMTEEKAQAWGEQWRGKPGHEGYLLRSVAALPEVMQDGGYHTMMSGKWHLGYKPDQIPGKWGFDRSISMLAALHNHYAWEPQFTDTDPRDLALKEALPGWYTKKNMYTKDQEYLEVQSNFPKKEGGFYSTEYWTDRLLEMIKERRETPELKEKPFFAYYAFTAPHYPLQAPREIRDKYKGVYDDGPHALREKRLERLSKMGLIDESAKPHELVNIWKRKEWDHFSPEEKAKSCRAMETFAAMVDMVDTNVGKVIDQLRDDGELDNTFVLFMSDNGAEGASYEAIPLYGDVFMNAVDRFYDNSLENIGEPNSFVWYGSMWAQASTAPSRLFKMWTSEGGIRVPCIVRYPEMSCNPALSPGSSAPVFQTCMDIMPTILDLAGLEKPGKVFRGRQVVPIRGKSWAGWIKGEDKQVHDTVAIPQGWELHGCAALRKGDWKLLYLPPPGGRGEWELYDLSKDPGETNDLASQQSEKLEELKKEWEIYVSESQVVWGVKDGMVARPNYVRDQNEEEEQAARTGAKEPVQVLPVDHTEDARGWMNAKAKVKAGV